MIKRSSTVVVSCVITGLCTVSILSLSGCASSRSGKVYGRDQAREMHTVRMGTIEEVYMVRIEGTKTGIGTVAGAVIGGAVGSTVGDGSGRRVAAAVGSAAGAVAGSATEEGVTRRQGYEITVKMDDGQTIAVVQEADVPFNPGERVKILTGYDGTIRVRKTGTASTGTYPTYR